MALRIERPGEFPSRPHHHVPVCAWEHGPLLLRDVDSSGRQEVDDDGGRADILFLSDHDDARTRQLRLLSAVSIPPKL